MFSKLKETITELAASAVNIAEETLATSSGQEKKLAAINYVIEMLPIATVFKGLIAAILSKFIDNAIEKAVEYMKQAEVQNG